MSHKKPVTRRDFLAQGLLGTSAYLFTPSLITMLAAKRAYGADCAAAALSRKTAFICLDLAGGSNIAGSNVIVGKQGGQLDYLSSYTLLGLPDSMRPTGTGQVNRDFGLAFHADSGMLRGMLSVTSPSTRANVDGIVLCSQSGDDTGNNPHNPTYWITKAGLTGTLTALAGSSTSISGGNSMAPAMSVNPAARPVRLVRPADARDLATLGQLNTLFSPAKVDRIMGTIENLSNSHLAAFQEKDLPSQIREVLGCSFVKAKTTAQEGADRLDPLRDAMVTSVFPNIANNGEDQKVATIAKLVLDNVAGGGTIQKGGYDYHSGNRADGEIKDFEAGVAIGQCLELAARKGKDLMLYIFTDGGVASNGTLDNSVAGRGKGVWTGDSGERSAAFILVYRAGSGRPSLRNQLRQVGYFRESGQSVDSNSSVIARDVEKLSMAVVLNYLALDGSEGNFSNIVLGANPFMGAMDKYLLFNRLG
jgi:hypothetical protein